MKKNASDGFIKNTLRLVFGNVGAQTINLLSIPILSRIYTPDSYGVFTLFFSVFAIITSISCLRFETVILLPKEDKEVLNVFTLCLIFISFFAMLTTLFAMLFKHNIHYLPGTYQKIVPYLFLFSFFVFIDGVARALSFVAVRKNKFIIQSVSRISNAAVSKGFSILHGILIADSPLGLIGGMACGQLLSCLLFFRYLFTNYFKIAKTITLESLKCSFKRYKAFAFYSGSAVLEIFSREIAPLALGFMFGSVVVGFFGLTSRFLQQPLILIGDAIYRSFFQKIAENHRNGIKYDTLVYTLIKNLMMLILMPTLLFTTIAPEIFEMFFGEKWLPSGVYFNILSISYISSFLFRPVSIVLDIQEKQRLRFGYNVIRLCINGIAIYSGGYFFGTPLYAIGFYSASNSFLTFGFIVIAAKMAGISCKSLMKLIVVQFVFCLAGFTFLRFFKRAFNFDIEIMACVVALCISAHFAYMYYLFVKSHKLNRFPIH